jgi:hypothetical protein
MLGMKMMDTDVPRGHVMTRRKIKHQGRFSAFFREWSLRLSFKYIILQYIPIKGPPLSSIRDGSLLQFRKPPLHLSEIALWKIHWIKGIIHVQCVERFKVPLHMERN